MECAVCRRFVPDEYAEEVDGVAYCRGHAVYSLSAQEDDAEPDPVGEPAEDPEEAEDP